jgi:hypothetical protein
MSHYVDENFMNDIDDDVYDETYIVRREIIECSNTIRMMLDTMKYFGE